MDKLRVAPLLLSVLLFVPVCASSAAQGTNADYDPDHPQGKEVPQARTSHAFSLDASGQVSHTVEFRNPDQMNARDRLLVANAEGSIGEAAGYDGLDFAEGPWSYQQIVCPALPKHIFLRFLRNNGENDVSMFTAVVPSGDEGKVRIIPIRRRGYSMFSPAPINALTIAAFNRVRSEENPDKSPATDWLGTAMCYAALAGGRPVLGHPGVSPETEKYPLEQSAYLRVRPRSGDEISFSDVGPATRPIEWTMKFNPDGKLIKASRSPAPLVQGYLYLRPGHGNAAAIERAKSQPMTVENPAPLIPAGQVVAPGNPPVMQQVSAPTPVAAPTVPAPVTPAASAPEPAAPVAPAATPAPPPPPVDLPTQPVTAPPPQ